MIRLHCPYCGAEIADVPQNGLCPECRGELSQKGSPETAAFRRRLPWVFFFLAILPNTLSWLGMYSGFSELANEWDSVLMLLIPSIICPCWVHFIMPENSLYINREVPPDRRSNQGGMQICVRTFVIFEVLLLIIGLFWSTEYIRAYPGILVAYHVTSVHYLILGLFNVYYHEYVMFDVIYRRVEKQLLPYRGVGSSKYPTLQVAFLVAGFLLGWIVYWVANKLGIPIR